jgi:hypothetical protein
MPAPDNSGKPFALAHPDDMHLLSGLEYVDQNLIALFEGRLLIEAEFPQDPRQRRT